jgi:hypothetical protein
MRGDSPASRRLSAEEKAVALPANMGIGFSEKIMLKSKR